VGSATSVNFLTYNLPLKENTMSHCNKHFTTTKKKRLQEGKINGSQEKKIKTITEILIKIIETK
jgi:hypothetical protein